MAELVRHTVVLMGALTIISCAKDVPQTEPEPTDAVENPTRWTGTMPCADCDGITYDLELDPEAGRFLLLTTYLGTPDGDKSYERTGRYVWNETVVCLTPALPEPEECFLLADANTLLRINMSGEVTDHALRRQ